MLENYRFLGKYNQWMNEKLYESASKLPDTLRKLNRGAFFGSIHNTLNHLVLTDKIWLGRFAAQGVEFQSLSDDILGVPGGFKSLGQVLYDDFAELKAQRIKIDQAVENWLTEMPPDFPMQVMKYANMKGMMREHPMWQALTHFFNHQTHHRGQVTVLINQAGIDPGVTDLIAMIDLKK
jgi:uncharacterized damage-inducible protein DinB